MLGGIHKQMLNGCTVCQPFSDLVQSIGPQNPQSISREPCDVQIFRSKVKDSNGELSRLPEKVLFSAVPSRSFFPRGGPEMITIRNQDEPSHGKSFIVIQNNSSQNDSNLRMLWNAFDLQTQTTKIGIALPPELTML